MADGRIFIGEQARTAGLIDGISTLDSLLFRMASSEPVISKPQQKGTTTMSNSNEPRTFEAAVEQYLSSGKAKKRSEALSMAARNFPQFHEEYIDRANRERKDRGSR